MSETIVVDDNDQVIVTTEDSTITVVTEAQSPIQVLTEGIQGPPGVSGIAGYRVNIQPAGIQDDNNLIFTLPEEPVDVTFELFINGLLEDPDNYLLAGNMLTLTTPPRAWWRLAVSYFV